MQVNSSSSARAAWYDRNAKSVTQESYVANTAPHSNTQRWKYTVPSARKFIIERLVSNSIRESQATAVGTVYNASTYRSGLVSSATFAYFEFTDNTVKLFRDRSVTSNTTMFEGDSVDFATADASTGGTVTYEGALIGAEFDA